MFNIDNFIVWGVYYHCSNPKFPNVYQCHYPDLKWKLTLEMHVLKILIHNIKWKRLVYKIMYNKQCIHYQNHINKSDNISHLPDISTTAPTTYKCKIL